MSDRPLRNAPRRTGLGQGARVQLPLLDRLVDAEPDERTDRPLSASAALDAMRASICSDLEELLNTRRRWQSWNPELSELDRSLVGFGLPDFAGGAFNDPRRREELRQRIEAAIRRFEPRIVSLKVTLVEATDSVSATMRLRIDAMMRAEPNPEPIAFATVVDLITKSVAVREQES